MNETESAKEKKRTGPEAGQRLGGGHDNLDAVPFGMCCLGLHQGVDVDGDDDHFEGLRARVLCYRDAALQELWRGNVASYRVRTVSKSEHNDMSVVREYEMILPQLLQWFEVHRSREPLEEIAEIHPVGCYEN